MSVLQGTPYPAAITAPADLTGSTVVLTVTAPDGTTTHPSAAVTGSTATATVPAAQVGTYLLWWVVTGPAATVVQDQFTVDAPELDLVSLTDLRTDLNIGGTSLDPQLRRWLKAASGVIEAITGPIRPRPRTDWFPGGGTELLLPARWVSSITAVTETSSTATTVLPAWTFDGAHTGPAYLWDRAINLLTRIDGRGGPSRFPDGSQAVQVDYVAGLTTIPDEIQLAAVELIRHWYRKNGSPFRNASFGQATGDDVVTVGNYIVPNSLMELLEPWRRPPVIA